MHPVHALTGPIEEPVGPAAARRLRRAVLDHRLRERRPQHPVSLWVGEPGAAATVHVVERHDPDDLAARTDVVAAMLRRVRRHGVETPLVWLTRPGPLHPEDCDGAWLASSLMAFAEAEVPLTMVVVDRRGWRDPRTGVHRTWRRLRAG